MEAKATNWIMCMKGIPCGVPFLISPKRKEEK
nr:MAG TPA: hypothetical protein [Caudoviricetes sp.]